jgi:hypothetical protein
MTRPDAMPQRRDRDLDDPLEIAEMVRRFYSDVAQDDLLGPIFNDVAQVDWSAHLPKITAFWCRTLLAIPGYEGNPYRQHQLVHARSTSSTIMPTSLDPRPASGQGPWSSLRRRSAGDLRPWPPR